MGTIEIGDVVSGGQFVLCSWGHLFKMQTIVNFVTWSLEIEVQFYLVMPFLAIVYRIRAAWLRRAIMAVLAALVCFPTGVAWWDGIASNPHFLTGYLEYFVAGMWLADLTSTTSEPRRPRLIWDPIFLLCVAMLGLPPAVPGRIGLVCVTSLVFEAGCRGGVR